MKIPITKNKKYKELAEYLKTKESGQAFIQCLASDKDWDDFLKEKGVLEEVTTYVEFKMPEIYKSNEKIK